VYIKKGEGLGQAPTLYGSLAGKLGEGVDSKKIINDFLNQVRQQPQSFKKLLLTVALHPKPEDSRIWEKQTFTFGKETRYLVDEILMSGLSTAFILTVLKRYSDASFKQQIQDEGNLQIRMINATASLDKVLLQPFLFDPLLLPASVNYRETIRLARHFAQNMLPEGLARQIMKSDASEAHLAYLWVYLRSRAEQLEKQDRHFKKLVEIARKWQRERERRRKQQATKKVP